MAKCQASYCNSGYGMPPAVSGPTAIPEGVLPLVRHRWRLPEAGYSAFDSVFDPPFENLPTPGAIEAEARASHLDYVLGRRRDPSCYYIPRELTDSDHRPEGRLI